MSATPEYGMLYARGARTGMQVNIHLYNPDTVNGAVTFDGGLGAGSGSPAQYQLPNEDLIVYDYSVATGLAQTTMLVFAANNKIISQSRIVQANHINTLNNRPPLNLRFPAGALLQAFNQ